MEIEVLAIEINQEPIELYKLLKIANLVGGGGEAKIVISEGYVYLNGEVEYQKRKKVNFEDIVQFNGEAIMPIPAENPVIAEPKQNIESPNKAPKKDTKRNSNKTSTKANSEKSNAKKQQLKNSNSKTKNKPEKDNSRSGRKSISF